MGERSEVGQPREECQNQRRQRVISSEVVIRRLFAKRPFQGLRVVLLLLLSLGLMVIDWDLQGFYRLRASFLAQVVGPLQSLVNAPSHWCQAGLGYLRTKNQLVAANTQLKLQLLQARVPLQRLQAVLQENKQLRELLHATQTLSEPVILVKLTTIGARSFEPQVIINAGKLAGITVGRPVLDAYGIFGQTIEVHEKISRVLQITDRKSAVPALVTRNNLQVIAVGAGDHQSLELVNMPITSDLKEGDILVSSGIGEVFPVGYPVGVIKRIRQVLGERFLKVTVSPSAQVNKSSNLLVLLQDPQVKRGTDEL